MNIQITHDHSITGSESFRARVESIVESSLSRVQDRVNSVEVHLADETGNKPGHDDKRCVMEARLNGRHASAVTCHAGTIDDAIDGAAEKLKHSIEGTLDRRER